MTQSEQVKATEAFEKAELLKRKAIQWKPSKRKA